jgi:DNA-directed RNA polymerase subunit RPC12/RpoP
MSNESQQGTAKGIDGAVKYCMSCGVEFDPALKSAVGIKCNNCEIEFSVRVITPNE